MSVVSAAAVVSMFLLLVQLGGSKSTALWLSLVYGFGTPVFYRTGFLNHNMMLGHTAFAGFVTLWNPWAAATTVTTTVTARGASARRVALAGLAGGFCLLLDYSGIVILVGLPIYGLLLLRPTTHPARVRYLAAYGAGALGPLAVLWFYQWQSFGHPFLPPQHWMPLVEWIGEGYQGVDLPQPGLALSLAFDWRYGLFTSGPLFVLALWAPFASRGEQPRERPVGRATFPLPRLELWTCLCLAVALWLFFSGIHYTRWQFNTGVRYLAPTFPFLFLLAAGVMLDLPRWGARLITGLAVGQAWCMAMYRDVSGGKVELADPDVGLGVLEPIVRVWSDGPTLPVLTTLSRMEGYGSLTDGLLSPAPIFILAAVALAVMWWPIVAETPSVMPAPRRHGGR